MPYVASVLYRRLRVFAAVVASGSATFAFAQQVEPETAPEAPPVPTVQPTPAEDAHPAPLEVPDPGDAAMMSKLKQTIDAYANAKTLTFHSKTAFTGFLDGKSPATEANVRMVRPADNPTAWIIESSGTGKRKASDAPVPFEVVWSPTWISWLDHDHKKLMDRPSGQGRGLPVQMAAGSVPSQISDRTPFARELTAEAITVEEADAVGGVSCELLTVRPKGKRGAIKFWVGIEDRLIRKIERVSETTQFGSSTVIEMTDVKLNEPIDPESLTIALPDGYERDAVERPAAAGAAPTNASRLPSLAVRPPISPGATPTTGAPAAAEPEANASAEAPPTPAAAPGDELAACPAFQAKAADGGVVSAQTLHGEPAVLMFFGSWSLASKSSEAALGAVIDDLKLGPMKAVAFAVREKSAQAPADFLAASKRAYTLVPEGDQTAKMFGVRVIPTVVFITAEGKIASRVEGFRKNDTPDEFRAGLRSAFGVRPESGGASGTIHESVTTER